MSLDQDIEFLQHVALFQGFSLEQFRLLAFGASHKVMRKDEILFYKDEISNGGYVVLSGQIDLISYEDGQENLIESYQSKSLIGELALISSNNRPASAISRGETQLLFISRDTFHRMLDEFPELAVLLQERIQKNIDVMLNRMNAVEYKLNTIPNIS